MTNLTSLTLEHCHQRYFPTSFVTDLPKLQYFGCFFIFSTITPPTPLREGLLPYPHLHIELSKDYDPSVYTFLVQMSSIINLAKMQDYSAFMIHTILFMVPAVRTLEGINDGVVIPTINGALGVNNKHIKNWSLNRFTLLTLFDISPS
jgi:hypothetical protein